MHLLYEISKIKFTTISSFHRNRSSERSKNQAYQEVGNRRLFKGTICGLPNKFFGYLDDKQWTQLMLEDYTSKWCGFITMSADFACSIKINTYFRRPDSSVVFLFMHQLTWGSGPEAALCLIFYMVEIRLSFTHTQKIKLSQCFISSTWQM